MKFKKEDGFTGVDIAIAVVVMFIFVSLIAMLSYQMNSTTKEIELKAKACEIAIEEIEKIKNKTLEEIETEEETYQDNTEVEEGFFRDIYVQDYHEIDNTKEEGFVKKVTVQIKYKYKKEIQEVALSTMLSKER